MAQLAQLAHGLRLAALEVADEVPAERVAVARVLRREVLLAVLADDLDSRVHERLHVVEGDVLRRGHDRDARADLRPDPLVPRRGSRQATRATTPWTPRGFPSRRWEKKSPARTPCRGRDARRARRRRRATPSAARQRSSRPPRRSRARSARGTGGDVVAHLEAARPDGGAEAAASSPSPSAATALSTIPASRPRQPTWRTATAGGRAVGARDARSEGSRRSSRGSAGRARPSRDRRRARRARPAAPDARARSAPGS